MNSSNLPHNHNELKTRKSKHVQSTSVDSAEELQQAKPKPQNNFETRQLRESLSDLVANEIHNGTINALNDDCLVGIFEWLQLADLVRASCTCRRWRMLITNLPSLWKSVTISPTNITSIPAVMRYTPHIRYLKLKDLELHISVTYDLSWTQSLVANLLRECGSHRLVSLEIEDNGEGNLLNQWDHECIFEIIGKYCTHLTSLTIKCSEEAGYVSDEAFLLLTFKTNQMEVFIDETAYGIGEGALMYMCDSWKHLRKLKTNTEYKFASRFFELVRPMRNKLTSLEITHFRDSFTEEFNNIVEELRGFINLSRLQLEFETTNYMEGLYPHHITTILDAIPTLTEFSYVTSPESYYDLPRPTRRTSPFYQSGMYGNDEDAILEQMNKCAELSSEESAVKEFLETMKGIRGVCKARGVKLDLCWAL